MFTEEDEEPQEVTTKSDDDENRVRARSIDVCRLINSLMDGDVRKSSDNLGEENPSALMLARSTFLCST